MLVEIPIPEKQTFIICDSFGKWALLPLLYHNLNCWALVATLSKSLREKLGYNELVIFQNKEPLKENVCL